MTSASRSDPFSLFHRGSALLASLKTIARIPSRDTQPRVFAALNRTVEKVPLGGIGFVVRICTQCSVPRRGIVESQQRLTIFGQTLSGFLVLQLTGSDEAIERCVTWLTGSEHIRETIPFPRMLYRLKP